MAGSVNNCTSNGKESDEGRSVKVARERLRKSNHPHFARFSRTPAVSKFERVGFFVKTREDFNGTSCGTLARLFCIATNEAAQSFVVFKGRGFPTACRAFGRNTTLHVQSWFPAFEHREGWVASAR